MTRDWEASTYHRVSAPHQKWAEALLERLALRGDEIVLDAGCGSGRVTLRLLERLPHGRVIAVDGSASMVAQARDVLPDEVEVLHQDLLALSVREPVDAIFSSAVFHWIADHETLFARLGAALKTGGRLVAQCGGHGNIARFRAHADQVAAREPYVSAFSGFRSPWLYATPEDTERRLRVAGFSEARAWLEPWPVTSPEPFEYLRTVCLGPHTDHLPDELREPYVRDVLAGSGEPLELDYVRLNINAQRA